MYIMIIKFMLSESDSKTFLQAATAIDRLISKLKPQTSTKIFNCLVGLYTSEQSKGNELQYTNKICMMNIDIDRSIKNHVLRFYDIEDLKLLCQMELYYGFDQNYRQVQNEQNLYMFDSTNFSSIAILYRNKIQAENALSKIKIISPKIQEFRQIQDQKIEKLQKTIKTKNLTEKFMHLKNFVLGNNAQNQEELQQSTESQILKVQKNGSITFDINNGFNATNMSPQIEEMFAAMLNTKKQTVR